MKTIKKLLASLILGPIIILCLPVFVVLFVYIHTMNWALRQFGLNSNWEKI